ncbi:hypothetical protein KV557_40610, partial [Kitasatospora aureofaciens]|nr:hypothetical protein [Kitasatospora aureofaciens]
MNLRPLDPQRAAASRARGGVLSIGATTTVGSYLVLPLPQTLRRRFPQVEVDLQIGNQESLLGGCSPGRARWTCWPGARGSPGWSRPRSRTRGWSWWLAGATSCPVGARPRPNSPPGCSCCARRGRATAAPRRRPSRSGGSRTSGVPRGLRRGHQATTGDAGRADETRLPGHEAKRNRSSTEPRPVIHERLWPLAGTRQSGEDAAHGLDGGVLPHEAARVSRTAPHRRRTGRRRRRAA